MIESVQKQLEHSLSVLAVESSHSWDDIEKQYRQLIQRWHPDRNSDENSETAQSKFIEINIAYKLVKEHYRKHGAIPRPISSISVSTKHDGPLLGTKKPVKAKVPLHKNKFVLCVALSLALVSVIGALLWSLDSRLAENNRDRATIEKTDTFLSTRLQTKNTLQSKSKNHDQDIKHGVIKQSTNEVEQ